MTILIAPDSFKGSLTAAQAAFIIREAFLAGDPAARCILLPQADGGEGTIDAVLSSAGGTLETVHIPDLSGRTVPVQFLLREDGSSLIEAARIIGWRLPKGVRRQVRYFSSSSFGKLLLATAEKSSRIEAAIGGSATSDCGLGLAEALGAVCKGGALSHADIPRRLAAIHRIVYTQPDLPPVRVLADVKNPLCGQHGAVYSYGPQKGIADDDLARWNGAFINFAGVVRRDVRDVDSTAEGMGAAGGLGFALSAFTGASILKGADELRLQTGFDEYLPEADLVITGEGRIDTQTLYGKVIEGIARSAAEYNVPVVAFTGTAGNDIDAVIDELTLQKVIPLTAKGDPIERAIQQAPARLYTAVREFVRSYCN